ncbi:MAG: iron-containing alcohol dehydrogenase [Firmicutes bacterium]|nr:iron-containing alcohol dehydrogenase [Bacillota bacterium]
MHFNFRCPTRLFFGINCIVENSSELAALGNKGLVVTGKTSSKKNGSLRDIVAAFSKENIQYNIFDEVEENPSLTTVYNAAVMAKRMEADFIVGIGGGSPLDAAKAVAVLVNNDISEEELMARRWTNTPLPIAAIPTTAGTGSEVTPYSILTVDEEETKKSIAGEDLFPKVAFLNARYTRHLPWDITVNTAVDALSHSIEAYVNNQASVFSDLLALESISIIGRLLKNLDEDDITMEQRWELLYASMLGGVVIAQTATGVVHALGYPLTYFKGLPHGLANGVITKASLEFLAQGDAERVEKVVQAMGCSSLDEVGQLLEQMLPAVDIKLTAEEQEIFVEKTMTAKNINNCPHKPKKKDIYQILKNSNLV